MRLYEAIGKQEGVTVVLQSSPSHDQFVVMLCDKNKQWFVYDPLTNPELLFPHQDYQSDILSLFPRVQAPKSHLKLKITEAVYSRYAQKSSQIQDYLKEAFRTFDTSNALKNRGYRASLIQRNLVPENQYLSITSCAITALRELSEPEPAAQSSIS